jgi:formate dehydrogenase subunit gamma
MQIDKKTITVLRHELLFRILHWAIFAEGIFLTLTGMQLGGILGIVVFPTNNLSYHIMVGFVFIGTVTLFIYDLAITRDYRWVGLRRIPYSIKYIFLETKAWFGLSRKPEEPELYDAKKGEYVEKLILSVIVVFWIFVLLGLVLALTGLALAYSGTFSIVYTIVNPIGSTLVGVTGLPLMLAIHRLATYLLVAVVVLHMYASFLYKLVGTMITGREKVKSI